MLGASRAVQYGKDSKKHLRSRKFICIKYSGSSPTIAYADHLSRPLIELTLHLLSAEHYLP
jgi:hypothetical protein